MDISKRQYKYNNQITKEPHGVDCSFKMITTAINLYEKLYKNVALEKGQSVDYAKNVTILRSHIAFYYLSVVTSLSCTQHA